MAAATVLLAVLAGHRPVEADPGHRHERDQTLVIARISSNTSSQYEKLEALNDYVVPKLKAAGIHRGKVIIAADPAQMDALLEAGEVDYLSETAYVALRLERRGAAKIVLHEWKNGQPFYHSVFIAAMDGPASVEALAGRRLVLEDPDSTSGFLQPYLHLIRLGLRPVPFDSLSSVKPAANAVIYDFASDETSVLARVLRGRADAGVVSNIEWRKEIRTPAFKRNLRVIGQTPPTVRSLTLVRASLSPEVRAALLETLMGISDDPAAADITKTYFHTSKFVPLSPEVDKQLTDMRRAIARHLPEP